MQGIFLIGVSFTAHQLINFLAVKKVRKIKSIQSHLIISCDEQLIDSYS